MAHEAEAAGIIAASSGTGPGADGRLTASAVGRLVETVTAGVTVTRREVRGYYVRNGDRYRRREARRVRHILLPDAMTARDAIRRLAAGADMAVLAEEVSIDAGTRTRGGQLGDVHRGELSGPLEDAIFSATVGTIFGPIRTEHGWHVARVDAVAGGVVHAVRGGSPGDRGGSPGRRTQPACSGRGSSDRRAALAVIAPGFEHPADPVHGFPSHRH